MPIADHIAWAVRSAKKVKLQHRDYCGFIHRLCDHLRPTIHHSIINKSSLLNATAGGVFMVQLKARNDQPSPGSASAENNNCHSMRIGNKGEHAELNAKRINCNNGFDIPSSRCTERLLPYRSSLAPFTTRAGRMQPFYCSSTLSSIEWVAA